jgi:15-cis-phytoene synthase
MGDTPDRSHGPLDLGRHLASLYSLPAERPILEALFALESEIGASLHAGLDHTVAHVRLQWWREECARVASGTPSHPLTRALAAEFPNTPGDALAGLAGFVDVAVWDLAAATFETRRELQAFCERWAAAMMLPAVAHAAPQAKDPWLAIGAAMYEVQMLANLDTDARAGRLRLPLDELERAGVKPESLVATPHAPQLTSLLRERHTRLRCVLADSIGRVPQTAQPALRGLLVWANMSWRRSQQLERALPGPRQPQAFEALADAWYAWRAARHATTGKLRLASDAH